MIAEKQALKTLSQILIQNSLKIRITLQNSDPNPVNLLPPTLTSIQSSHHKNTQNFIKKNAQNDNSSAQNHEKLKISKIAKRTRNFRYRNRSICVTEDFGREMRRHRRRFTVLREKARLRGLEVNGFGKEIMSSLTRSL